MRPASIFLIIQLSNSRVDMNQQAYMIGLDEIDAMLRQ